MRKLALLFAGALLCTLQLMAQNTTITGRVTDAKDGSPLADVSVTASGTKVGVKTDVDGTYSITFPSTARTLTYTYVGYQSVSRAVGKLLSIDVELTSAQSNLDEVVVVGYGTARKKELTGSVSTIGGGKIRDLPVQSFDQALSGRAAGVNITIPNGVVNNPPVIRVRGVNSISLSSFPLVVIDGIPTFSGDVGNSASNNPLGDINPSDIESIEVLKDAAAAAIYGSRASAGVLLITTKKGRQGRASVRYDGWIGATEAFNLIPVLNGREYEQIKNEGLSNAGTPATPGVRGFFPYNGPDGNPVSTNWYDVIYRTGFSQNHTLSVSGANDKTSYYFSAAYSDQEGFIVQNDFRRLNATMSLDHKVTNAITVGGKFQYANSLNFGVNSGSQPGGAFATSGIGRLGFNLMPNVPVFLNDGSYNINRTANTIGWANNLTALQFTNPQLLLDRNKFSSENDRVIANIYANVKLPIKGLNYRLTYGIDNLSTINKTFWNAEHGDGVPTAGLVTNTSQLYRRWNLINTLQYNRGFGNHNISALVGSEQQSTKAEGFGATRQGVTDPFYDEFQGGWNTIVPAGAFLGENFLSSYFGRINYDFDKRYLFSVNARRDGYSAFSPDNKWGNFWGVSGGWVASEEKFFKNSGLSNIFSNLKLRASYGIVGNNQGINDFAFWSYFSSGLYGTNPSLFFSQAGNTNLKWETSKKTDIGLELGFLNNRITSEITYYINDVDNLILAEPQAPSRGIPGNSILTNVGSMTNKGIEFTLNASVIQKRDFSWSTNFNITTLRNEVTALAAGNADIQPATSGLERPSIIRVGQSIGSFYAVRTGGVNPANGQRIFYYRDGTAVQYNHAAAPADRWTLVATGARAPRVADQANDGVVIGPALPRWYGGWENTFRYKGLDFNFQFFFSGGNYVYNGSRAGMLDQRSWNNSKEVLNRWQRPGDVTNIPRVVFGDNISNGSGVVISENIEKGDFLKLRNLTLGYTLPKSITDKIRIQNFRVFAQLWNAFTITNYSGYDPEISSNGNGNGNPSVDRNSVPQARIYNFGVNVGF